MRKALERIARLKAIDEPRCPYCVKDGGFRLLLILGDGFVCDKCGHYLASERVCLPMRLLELPEAKILGQTLSNAVLGHYRQTRAASTAPVARIGVQHFNVGVATFQLFFVIKNARFAAYFAPTHN